MSLLEVGWRTLGHAVGHPAKAWWPRPHPAPAAGVLHGASAGEVKAARSVLELLPAEAWTVTTGTPAGVAAGADGRLPRDVPGAVRSFFDEVRPERLVLVEGDLWPSLLLEAATRSVPVGVVGARMSPRAWSRWRSARGAARSILSRIRAFAAASGGDADRLVDLGADPACVQVTGWLKFPSLPTPEAQAACRHPHRDARPLLVAGSVHPGEVRALASVLDRSGRPASSFQWVVVPRHPTRADAIAREVQPLPGAYVERGFGTLAAWYFVADAAFVGGGFAGRGVHDLLEPLAAGLSPLHFAARGDAGGVSERLTRSDLALRLDGPAPADPARSLEAAPLDWAGIRTRFDGRRASLNHLRALGVLPAGGAA